MQINDLANKVNDISSAWENFKSTNEQRLAEIEKKGAADPLSNEQVNKINNHIDEQKSRLAKLETTMMRPESSAIGDVHDGHKSAFINYMRKGVDIDLPRYETKSLSVSNKEDGGYLVASSLSNQIVKNLANNSVMRQLASIETISTDSLDILMDLEDFESGWAGETEARKETGSAKIKRHKIFVHEMYAQPKATQKLIDDASIDIGKWIVEKISESFAKIENDSFIFGDGENKPRGILTYDSNAIECMSSGVEAGFNANSLIDLHYSLGSDYAANGKFLMHRNTLQQIRSLKCPTTGQYLWSPALAAGAPDTLLGAEIVESPSMPIPSENSASIIFADFKAGYKIVDRHDIRILRDPFTEKPFVKFYATKRVGGEVINSDAIKILKLA